MKAKITGHRYVLAVKNLKVASDFFKNQLGFTTAWEEEGWHFLYRDQAKVMLGECANEVAASETGDHSYFAYFEIDDIDELYREYQEKGVVVLHPIEDKPWGQREFAVRTPDGHRMTFGAPI